MSDIVLEIETLRPIRFVNVGEDPPKPKPGSGWIGRRQWKSCITYSFLSAGQGTFYSKPLKSLQVGDIIAAYITGEGYVGIGKILKTAVPIKNFMHDGKFLKELQNLKTSLFDNSDNEKSEFVVKVQWIKTVQKEKAYWKKNSGLFASRLTQCTLEKQPKTLKFIEDCFRIKFV